MCWSVWEEVLNNIKMEKERRWSTCITCMWMTCQARVHCEVRRLAVKKMMKPCLLESKKYLLNSQLC